MVKTATTKFPVKYFQEQELANRGNTRGLVHFVNNSHSGMADVLSFMWIDHKHQLLFVRENFDCQSLKESVKQWLQCVISRIKIGGK